MRIICLVAIVTLTTSGVMGCTATQRTTSPAAVGGTVRGKCQLIIATNSAASKSLAARAAHENAIDRANQFRRQLGWRYVTLRARKVTPDPFWKTVRPVVTRNMLLKPDIVTAQTYSQCWRGVVVPYVCTAGAVACGS
jgi:hypothetical protein